VRKSLKIGYLHNNLKLVARGFEARTRHVDNYEMRKYIFYQLDVFTNTAFSGNPLAVFPEAENLTDEEMQKIANEMNLSETVFVFPSEKALTPFANFHAETGASARRSSGRRNLEFAGAARLNCAAGK
jgi:hypothetical protein